MSARQHRVIFRRRYVCFALDVYLDFTHRAADTTFSAKMLPLFVFSGRPRHLTFTFCVT